MESNLRKPFFIVEPQAVQTIMDRFLFSDTTFCVKKDAKRLTLALEFINKKVQYIAKTYQKVNSMSSVYDCEGLIFIENINNKTHWVVHHINITEGSNIQYNSTHNNRTEPTVFQQFIEKMLLLSNTMEKKKKNWKAVVERNVPTQINDSDCGVFAVCYMECIIRDVKINFSSSNMNCTREKMLFLMLHQNTMLYPSRDMWKMGLEKAHSIIKKLTLARNLPTNDRQQLDEPEMTQE